MFNFRFLILLVFLVNFLFANDNYIDSLTLTKIKKLVQKEEEIALAYKKYLLEKGENATTLAILKSNNYLPKGFEVNNPFAKEMKLMLDKGLILTEDQDGRKDDKHKIENFLPTDLKLKSNLYDYYYSNINRVHTKAPLSIKNNNVEIVFSSKEKFIYINKNKITTVKNSAISEIGGKYYLDTNGVLHWYQSGDYKFSVEKDLMVDGSVQLFEADGKTVRDDFKNMTSDVSFAGQNILHNSGDTVKEYIGIDEDTIIVKNPEISSVIVKGLLQFGKQSGGMIVNGDIYTWGNNENRITGINLDDYTKGSGVIGTLSPVVTTLVRVKAKMYDNDSTDDKNLTDFYTQNYFSSPLRPRFVDLFSSTNHGTCGITTNGELFCGGLTANNTDYVNTFVDITAIDTVEMLYRSRYFDGTTDSKKASKIFANNKLWLILSKDGDIYRWGYENTDKNGFSGSGTSTYNEVVCVKVCKKYAGNGKCIKYQKELSCSDYSDLNPEKINISTTKFTDITHSFADGYRKIAALSNAGDIYIWGMDTNIATIPNCSVTWEGVTINLCSPTKVTKDNSTLIENITFKSIKGGLRAIIALGNDGKYYKIEQPKDKKIQVSEIVVPANILSIDLTNEGTLIYVTSDNKLISTHFDSTSFDNTFRNTINSMSWKSIKVLEEGNGMCGLNTDNQMYCWGVQTHLSTTEQEENTFMLPVFNTNLYDSNKDYLVVEGGSSNILTTMTSGTWLSSSKFFIKYPTYIGGFNYEFIFK